MQILFIYTNKVNEVTRSRIMPLVYSCVLGKIRNPHYKENIILESKMILSYLLYGLIGAICYKYYS